MNRRSLDRAPVTSPQPRGCLLVFALVTVGGCSDTSSEPPETAQLEFCDSSAFTPPAESPYVLPFGPGETFRMFQGNCFPGGGHRGTFAYDFEMPIGTPILAARPGFVLSANDQYADTDHTSGHENNVFVRHADGTVVRYTHMQEGGVVVAAGDSVQLGQLLGLSGNSGASDRPHLHLQLFRSATYRGDNALPMTFRNVIGRTRSTGELIMGESYRAAPSGTSP